MSNGCGLHFFQDPADQKVYIYSHMEPFFCHRVFPCFDQPSIRASLKLRVKVPCPHWQVIANAPELRHYEREWEFQETEKISSYVYNLCAGDFELAAQQNVGSLPMRIFVRASKLQNVNSDLIFRVVLAGLEFYEEMFDCKFPFEKYDMIYCPEFRIGAMENVGAVTFTDNYLQP